MARIFAAILTGLTALAVTGPAFASTSLLGPGNANWFYACGGGQMMNFAIRHTDGSLTRFSLGPGESVRTAVQQGDVEAWRCGAPVDPAANFLFIVTVPTPTGSSY